MIVCPTCARRNEDHYKFCLGCGTELAGAAREVTVKPAAPAAAAPTALPRATPLRVAELGGPEAGALAPAAPPVAAPIAAPIAAPVATPVAAEAAAPAALESAPPPAAQAETEGPSTPPPAAAWSSRAVVLAPPDAFDDDIGTTQNELVPVQAGSEPDDADLPDDEGPDGSILGMPPPPSASVPISADPRACRSCGAHVPEGFKFCGVCGSRFELASIPVQATPHIAADHRARLVLIHPDGTEGEAFALDPGESSIGRNHPLPMFRNDPFLSPRHATFFFVRGQLFVRDEGSLNGVFLRIKAEVELFHRDMFRVGQQLLRFEEMSQIKPLVQGGTDDTTVIGSPVRGAWGRLVLVVGLDTHANVWILRRPEEQLGRERGEILFGEDGFVSGAHCKLTTRDGRFFLRDIGSTNGSYLRVKGEGILAQGDLLLLGQQLFKVDLLG